MESCTCRRRGGHGRPPWGDPHHRESGGGVSPEGEGIRLSRDHVMEALGLYAVKACLVCEVQKCHRTNNPEAFPVSWNFIKHVCFQGGLHVSPEGYGHMTHMLSGLAGGRVITVLEVRTVLTIIVCNALYTCAFPLGNSTQHVLTIIACNALYTVASQQGTPLNLGLTVIVCNALYTVVSQQGTPLLNLVVIGDQAMHSARGTYMY